MLKKAAICLVISFVISSQAMAGNVYIGGVKSAQTCNYFRNIYYKQSQRSQSGGAVAFGAGGIVGAFASSNRSDVEYMEYFTKDCYRNFPDAAATMNAIVSNIKLPLSSNARLDINISSVGLFEEAKSASPFGEELYANESSGLQVRVDYALYAAGSKKIDGGIVELRTSTYANEEVPGQSSRQSLDTRAAYNRIQGEIAKALVKRIIAKVDPLKIMRIEGDRAIIDRADPVIEPGDLLSVIDIDAATAYTLRVSSQSAGISIARNVNGEALPKSLVGSVVSSVEQESADDGPARPKVRLP